MGPVGVVECPWQVNLAKRRNHCKLESNKQRGEVADTVELPGRDHRMKDGLARRRGCRRRMGCVLLSSAIRDD